MGYTTTGERRVPSHRPGGHPRLPQQHADRQRELGRRGPRDARQHLPDLPDRAAVRPELRQPARQACRRRRSGHRARRRRRSSPASTPTRSTSPSSSRRRWRRTAGQVPIYEKVNAPLSEWGPVLAKIRAEPARRRLPRRLHRRRPRLVHEAVPRRPDAVAALRAVRPVGARVPEADRGRCERRDLVDRHRDPPRRDRQAVQGRLHGQVQARRRASASPARSATPSSSGGRRPPRRRARRPRQGHRDAQGLSVPRRVRLVQLRPNGPDGDLVSGHG